MGNSFRAARVFLHEISSPVGTAVILLETLLEQAQATNPSETSQLETVLNAVKKAQELIRMRRDQIVEEEKQFFVSK
jgi:hypothetical protein